MSDALTPLVDVYDGSIQAAKSYLDWYYNFLHMIFPSKSGNDYVTMPQIVTGTGAIYWTDENGVKRLETGGFILSSDLTSGATIFTAGGVKFDLVDNPDYSGGAVTSTYITADVTNGRYALNVSNVIRVRCTVAPGTRDTAVKLTSNVLAISGSPSYRYNGNANSNFGVADANLSTLKNDKNASFNIANAGDNVKLNDLRQNIISEINEQYPESTQNVDDFLTYDEWLNYENTDPTEPTTDGNGNGNIIINNYDNAIMNVDNTIDGNADIDLWGNVNVDVGTNAFGAGAFGAGAFADVDVNINAGAFGAGAFGAGAVGDVTVQGDIYNIESGAVLELPTLDYDEILSEKELEFILTSETYDIAELETDTFLTLEEGYTLPPPAPLPEGLVTMSAGVVSDTWAAFDSWGLTSVYLPLAIVSIVVFVLRGAK